MVWFRRALVLLGLLVLGSVLPASAQDEAGQAQAIQEPSGPPPDTPLVLGTGPIRGHAFSIGGALARAASTSGLRVVVEATAGTMENVYRLRTGDLDLALLRSDQVAAAIGGLDRFADQGPFDRLRIVAVLYAEPITWLVRSDSAAGTVGDLVGLHINLGPHDHPIRLLLESVLDALGAVPVADTDPPTPTPASIPYDRQVAALCDGEVDAIAIVSAHPSASVARALDACDMRLLPVTAPERQALIEGVALMTAEEIPAGVYGSDSPSVPAVGPYMVLVAPSHLPAASVAVIDTAVSSQRAALGSLHPTLRRLVSARLLREDWIGLIHEGAQR